MTHYSKLFLNKADVLKILKDTGKLEIRVFSQPMIPTYYTEVSTENRIRQNLFSILMKSGFNFSAQPRSTAMYCECYIWTFTEVE